MTLRPAFKTTVLIIILISILAILTVTVLSSLKKQTYAPTSAQPENSSDTQIETPLVLIPLSLKLVGEAVEPITYSITVDSSSRSIRALSLRFLLTDAQNSTDKPMFTLNPTLQQNGWQVVISTVTTGEAGPSFELALLNTQPDGGTMFETDIPLGTISTPKDVKYTLDPSVSIAVSREEERLGFRLVSQE